MLFSMEKFPFCSGSAGGVGGPELPVLVNWAPKQLIFTKVLGKGGGNLQFSVWAVSPSGSIKLQTWLGSVDSSCCWPLQVSKDFLEFAGFLPQEQSCRRCFSGDQFHIPLK